MNENRTPLDVNQFSAELEELSGKQPVTTSQVVNDATRVAARVVKDADVERLRSAADLINTFNAAIQDQAGRKQWMASDVRAFFIALTALDDIGLSEPTNYG